jgi:Ca2+-binding RTX toxin-like protein
VAQGDTVSITSAPGNGQLELADGTHVAANAVLTADQFAMLKFAPSDLGADTTANFQFTVSDGASETINTVPINLVHGSGVTITGGVANDHVIGSPGNDIINGGPGQDTLTGGGGADHFVFDHNAWADATASTPQIDHVTDYSAAQGDVFDFSTLTSAFHNSSASDVDLVRAVEDASGKFATLQINTSANGSIDPYMLPTIAPAATTASWVSVAQLDGVHASDPVNVLVDSHSAVHLAQIHVDLLV